MRSSRPDEPWRHRRGGTEPYALSGTAGSVGAWIRRGFPEKRLEFVREVELGNIIAQFVRYRFVHGGHHLGLEPTGRTVEFTEDLPLLKCDQITDSWRLTHPPSVSAGVGAG